MRPLNDRQRECLRFIASGETISNATLKAGYKSPAYGTTLLARPDAKAYLEKLRDVVVSTAIIGVTARKERLTEIANDADVKTSDQIKAIDTLNRMDGVYVTKIEAEVSHRGGVMLVPMVDNLGDWEKNAGPSQAKLMADAVNI
tara:strand:+ start:1666 stop:2097 length:432 start_codon:yes stop_codon:yes gene_type:complete